MLHDHVQQSGQHDLAARVDALWLAHQPRWRERIGVSFKRLGDAHLNVGGLAGPVVGEGKGMRDDWPKNLYQCGSFGSVWQAGADRAGLLPVCSRGCRRGRRIVRVRDAGCQ
ncbi:hypothetical protein D3C72_1125960 [compost metagenome]